MRVLTESKRQAIVDTATAVFLECGYGRASMAQIASRVGGSKATLYRYYRSKELLFSDVVDSFVERHVAPAFDALSGAAHGGAETEFTARLQSFGERLLGARCSPQALALRRMVIAEALQSGIGRRYFAAGPEFVFGRCAAFFAGAMQAGLMRPADPQTAAYQFVALIEAETVQPWLYGVIEAPAPDTIHRAVARALAPFWRAYQPDGA